MNAGYKILLTCFSFVFLISCKTSNEVVNNSLIQKRKYNKGYYFNVADNKNNVINNSENKLFANVTSIKPDLVSISSKYKNIIIKTYEGVKFKKQVIEEKPETSLITINQNPQQKINKDEDYVRSYNTAHTKPLLKANLISIMGNIATVIIILLTFNYSITNQIFIGMIIFSITAIVLVCLYAIYLSVIELNKIDIFELNWMQVLLLLSEIFFMSLLVSIAVYGIIFIAGLTIL